MELNKLPVYDASDNSTGCCPRFNPEGWDDQDLHFKNKPFVKVKTKSLFHIPVNMGPVFKKTFEAIEQAHAYDDKQFIVLSRDLSPWSAEHFFAVTDAVPGEEIVHLSGDYRTQVFEGPFKDVPKWQSQLRNRINATGETVDETYFFYTTCPKCAKVYGKNYLVAVAKLGSASK